MFNSVGLFRDIPCPKGNECELLQCIFSHTSLEESVARSVDQKVYDPASAGIDEPPAAKRRRLDLPSDDKLRSVSDQTFVRPPSVRVPKVHPTSQTPASIDVTKKDVTKPRHLNSITNSTRPVSPPPFRGAKKWEAASGSTLPRKESEQKAVLTPRKTAKAPAKHNIRDAYVKALHQNMQNLNKRLEDDGDDTQKVLALSPGELIHMAVDEEGKMADDLDEGIYRSAITQRIARLKKMPIDEWIKLIKETFRKPKTVEIDVQPRSKDDPTPIVTGLSSPDEEIAILRTLRTPLEELEKHGYVTSPPSTKEIEEAEKGVEATHGFELCERCGTRFQVFPGRDNQGRLTSGGTCLHHWGKPIRPLRQKTDKTTGQQEVYYPCCNRSVGSEGCTEGETHVFKIADVKRLAAVLQWNRTPEQQHSRKFLPISFDCEMGYTTLGMEIIRVTAVSWPQGKEVMDVLVRPQGEILDLNTRFSGVSRELYANALAYDADKSENGKAMSEDGELEPEPLRKVDSPAAARELLFRLLSPDTPLMGHAIENDLNACRIIHPFVIDTVLLYPHPKGLPIRYGLKMLTGKYLERGIQMGGALGHDSKEDAIATGDLVRLKVAEKWNMMRLKGWKLENGRLVEPDGDTSPS